MAATPSVVIVKQTLFRDVARRWGNRYHFNGGTPADTAHWNQLFDNIVTAEKAIFASSTSIVEAIGYAAGSSVPVATKTYTTAGTLISLPLPQALEVVALCRWSTPARTSKNHPVYLFNYWHAVGCQSVGEWDQLQVTQKTAMGTYAGTWISPGFSDGATSYVRAGPNGVTAGGQVVETYLTHRDFPR